MGAVEVQVAIVLDGSNSIEQADFDLMIEGLARAVEDPTIVKQDGSVEITVIQFADQISTGAKVEIPPIVIDNQATADDIAANIRGIKQAGGKTPLAAGVDLAREEITGSPSFSLSRKQVINVVTDGKPNRPDGTDVAEEAAIAARVRAIDAGIDELHAEGVGAAAADGESVRFLLELVWPRPGALAPPFPDPPGSAGFVQLVRDYQDFEEAIKEKLRIIPELPPPPDVSPPDLLDPLDLDWWAGELNKGDRALVQKIYINDNDNNADNDDVIITDLTVTICQEGEEVRDPNKHNIDPIVCVGTAKAGQDIVKIDVYFLEEPSFGIVDERLIASASYPDDFTDFPVSVPFIAGVDRTLDDDGEGILKLVATISDEPKNSHWVQLRTKVHFTEGEFGDSQYVTDSKPEHIRNPGWTVVDKNKFNSPLKPGVQMPIQKINVIDEHDGNTNGLAIVGFQVDNLGTATNDDLVDSEGLKFTNCKSGAERVVYGAANGFGEKVTFAARSEPTVADDGSAEFCIEVAVSTTATVGRTFVLATTLQIREGDETFPVQDFEVKDSKKEKISNPGCEFTDFTEDGPPIINLGEQQVKMQAFTCTDSDPDDADVVLTKVEIRNLGTATSDDISLIRVYDKKGNLVGHATGFGRIGLLNPDGTPLLVKDGGCTDCQEDSSAASSRTLTVEISINKHARTHDQDEDNTIRLQKIWFVKEQELEFAYTHITSVTDITTIGSATLRIETLTIGTDDEGSIDIKTNAPGLVDMQVGLTRAIVINAPDVDANTIIDVKEVIPCNTEHGKSPLDSPYEVLSWDVDVTDIGDITTALGADTVAAADNEIVVIFTVSLRPDRSQQPQQGCIVNIKFDAIGGADTAVDVDLFDMTASPPVSADDPDVFRDLLGFTIPVTTNAGSVSIVAPGTSDASGTGDVNGDTEVDITDAKCVAYFALGIPLPPACGQVDDTWIQNADVAKPSIADVQAKGLLAKDAIDITDARVIAQSALGLINLSVENSLILSPNPINNNVARFIATEDVVEMKVQVFDLTGRSIFDSGFVAGSTLEWHLVDNQGRALANGVYLYLYIATVRGYDGKTLNSEVKKLVILR